MYLSQSQFDGEGPGLQPSAAVESNAAASPVTAAASSVDPEMSKMAGYRAANASAASMSAPKATSKPIDKSNWNTSTKVSPSTVASVKSAGAGNMGYGAARNAAYGMPGYYGSGLVQNKPASNEYKEATKRVYPSAYKSVTTPFKPAPGTAGGGKYVGSTFVPNVKKSGSGGQTSSAAK
jgi:hypothetical protein